MARQRRRRIQTAGPARVLETLHPFLLLLLISAGLMLVPALHAVAVGDIALAETFFAAALVQGVLTLTVILATFGRPATTFGDNRLLALLLTYFALPLFLAVPLVLALPSLTWTRAYFEMLSCLTTTGATLFDEPGRIAPSIHLWRGLIGWLGGFIFLVAALAILAPLRLGGFEIEATLGTGASSRNRQVSTSAVATNARILRFARLVLVPYAVLTFALALLLMLAGEGGLVASVHAMSVLATSGISPLSGLDVAESGRMGEALMALFLIAAVTQKVMRVFWEREIGPPRLSDPEIKIAVASVVAITLLLFLRSYVAALDVEAQRDLPAALRAIWGSAFTVLSYLTTLGFESMDWGESRAWSGLGSPGLVLLALALMGGGIATTAGGVKLLRVYALYKHGVREMARLVHPNSVGGAGMTARRIRREGATLAWVFLMLFLFGIALTLLGLTLTGQGFEGALALSVAALTNTGPAAFLLDTGVRIADLPSAGHIILSVAMVFGRLEALVIIALLNPEFWRG